MISLRIREFEIIDTFGVTEISEYLNYRFFIYEIYENFIEMCIFVQILQDFTKT